MLKNMPIALTIDRKPARTTVPYGMAQMASGRSISKGGSGVTPGRPCKPDPSQELGTRALRNEPQCCVWGEGRLASHPGTASEALRARG